MNRKLTVVFLALMIGASALFGGTKVFAAGIGDGGGDEAGSNAGPCTTGNCYSSKYGAVWIYYKYSEKKDLKFPNPSYSISDSPQTISKTCGEVGGFWFLGYAGRNGNNVPTGYQLGPVNFGKTTLGSGTIPMIVRNSKVFIDLVYTNDEKYHYASLESGKRGKPVDRNKWNLHSGYNNVTAVKVGSLNEVADAYEAAQGTKGSDGKSVLPSPYNKADWGDKKMYNLVWFCSRQEDDEEVQGRFKSKSAVKTEKGETLNEDYDDHDGKANPYKITIPENQASTDVVFSHRLRISASDEKFNVYKKGGAYTEYKVTQSGYEDKTVVKKTKLYAKDLENMANYPKLHNKIVGENKVTVRVDKGATVTVCQKISYSPQTFTIKNGSFKSGKDEEYSQICVQVYRESNTVSSSFYSQSSVGGITTNRDENRSTPVKTIELSSDQATEIVTFSHIIGAEMGSNVYDKASSAGARTTWKVAQTSYNYNGSLRTGTTYLSNLDNVSGTNNYTDNVVNIPVTVSISQNSYVTVCQKIEYSTKNFTINGNSFSPQGNKGSSSICIRLHRPSPPRYCKNLVSGYLSNTNYGNTVAKTEVINYDSVTNAGWKEGTILAKPSDQIQFRHTLCFGVQAVTSSGRNEYGTTRKTAAQLNENDFPSNYFYLSGYRDDDYLFDRRDDSNYRYIPKATKKPTTFYYSPGSGATNFKPEETFEDYGIRFYSPKNSSTGGAANYYSNPYGCENNTLLSGWTIGYKANAYRIPDFDWGLCDSARNVAVGYSDAGSEIRQSLNYNALEAWIDYKHDKNNAICQGCESYYDLESAYYDNNSGTYSGTVPRDEPISLWYLSSARDAANSGSSYYWGYLEQDCKTSRCSNSGYQYRTSTSGCPTSPESTSECKTTWSSSAHTGCSLGYYQGSYNYSQYGNGHYYSDWNCHTNNQYYRGDKYNAPGRKGSSTTYHAGIIDYEQQKTATVKIPYNFKTETKASITGGDVAGGVVYAGERVDSSFAVSAIGRINPDVDPYNSYLTITPSDTVVQLVSFTVNGDYDVNAANNAVKGGISNNYENIQQYLTRKFGAYSGIGNWNLTLYYRSGAVNGDGSLLGPEIIAGEPSESIPDVEAGSKYCVAVGISHADSHGIPDVDLRAGQGVYGYSMNGANPAWRISNVSCRTIAKKPNFEAWGGVYTQGGIRASQSAKTRIDRLFGSWVDTLAIAAKKVTGFSSGAGLGYIGNGGGAASASKSYCNLISMTIANNLCTNSNRISGNAGSGINVADLLPQILARYTPAESKVPRSGNNVAAQPTQALNGGGQYTYVNGNANSIGSIVQTSGTRVIEVDGNVTIDQNICTGTGTCQYTGYNDLTLRDRNSHLYYSNTEGITNIPQVIIIARGNIKINPDVTQIDAWLFSSGTINTCTSGIVDIDTCNKTLIFNGPVFAKKLELNRTAGAYPGRNNIGAAYYDQDLVSASRQYNSTGYPTDPKYGSITPAEIFNLRPDAYYWAYNQANRLTQATVVYMRELAPRY